MIDQQLYLDGVLMDMGEDTEITLDIKSNLFRDITKMSTNSTYTINLPKTVHNMAVVEFSGKPKTSTKYPYIFHTARYFRNGLEIISNGRAAVLSVEETIEITIYWGLFPALTSLQDGDLKLNELVTTDHIKFYRENTAYKYDVAKEKGIFYANYDQTRVKETTDDWVNSDIAVTDTSKKTYYLGDGKIKTGTATGAAVSGQTVSDDDFVSKIVDFSAGMTASINQVVGKGEYRTWAVLNSNKGVVSLAADPATEEHKSLDTIPAYDFLAGTPKGGVALAAVRTKAEMTVKSILVAFKDSCPAGKLEWGCVDVSSGTMIKWGEADITEGTEKTTVTVGQYKEDGLLVYVKGSADGMLYAPMGSGGTQTYWIDGTTITESASGENFSVTYTSNSVTSDLEIQAPSTAAYLIINTLKKYYGGSALTITGGSATVATRASIGGGSSSGGGGSFSTVVGGLQPCVSCDYVLKLLAAQTKVNFEWGETAKKAIEKLAIPLISRNADGETVDGNLSGVLCNTSELGQMDFYLDEVSEVFSQQTAGQVYSSLTALISCTLIFDVQMYWSWNAKDVQATGTSTWTYGDTTGSEKYYNYFANYIEIKVVNKPDGTKTEEERTTTYVVGIYSEKTADTSFESDKVNDRFIRLSTGRGAIEIVEGDTITFEMKNPRSRALKGLSCYNGTITATLKQSDEVPYGGNFPIGINLPEVTAVDFLKMLCLLTSTFPCQDARKGVLKFLDINTIWNNKADAVDWSKRLIASSTYNQPRQTDFTIEDYCQHNIYKWKSDDTVIGDYDADLAVDNGTLEYTQDVWELPFAASDENRVPIYDWEDITSGFGDTDREEGSATSTRQAATKYSECEDRIMTYYKTNTGLTALKFDIDLQEIFDSNLAALKRTISSPRQLVERFNLSDIDILEFDEAKPIYLSQYGAYFAVLEIKTTGSGYAEVTMIELLQNDKTTEE